MGNKRLRSMSWEDYGISKNRYKELKAFCMQYQEKKDKIQYGLPSVKQDGMPGGSISTKSLVEQQAIENDRYKQDICMIYEAAVATDPDIWKYILRSVTEDLPYEYVMYDAEYGRIPVGKTEFYAMRRLFYSNLNKIKLGTN